MRIEYSFMVEGEYSTDTGCFDDPNDGDWEPFVMRDLHPAGEAKFTVWADGWGWQQKPTEIPNDVIQKAMTVVDWMRLEKGWWRFVASLWRVGPQDGKFERIAEWNLP